jgi:hypothetical protein
MLLRERSYAPWAGLRVILLADSSGRRLKQCSISSAAARRWFDSAAVSLGPFVEPKDISTASVRDLCLFVKETGV